MLGKLKFLFQTGSIRSSNNNELTQKVNKVSIPNWFD